MNESSMQQLHDAVSKNAVSQSCRGMLQQYNAVHIHIRSAHTVSRKGNPA